MGRNHTQETHSTPGSHTKQSPQISEFGPRTHADTMER
jgi:hypothetical protein